MSGSVSQLLEALGHPEEPFGMFYTDTEPKNGFVPKEGAKISYELEQRGELDLGALWKNWSCVMGQIWLARKRWEHSFLLTDTWSGVKKKVSRSREAWGE